MSGYTFKMEKVLEYRNHLEKKKVEDYTRVNMKLDEEKDRLLELQQIYDGKNQDQEKGLHEMRMQFLYKEKLKQDILGQQAQIRETEGKVDGARVLLIEARKNRKIMEILKDKDKTRYLQEASHKEQKELDDLSTMKYATRV